MPTFNLLIATPDATIFDGMVISAIFPGYDGFFEVLANHAPIIALVREGTLVLTDQDKNKQTVEIKQGFFEFYKNKGVLLSS